MLKLKLQVSTVHSIVLQSNDEPMYLVHDIHPRVVCPIVFPHPQSSCSARSHPSSSIFLALSHRLSISKHPHLPAVRHHPPNPVIHLLSFNRISSVNTMPLHCPSFPYLASRQDNTHPRSTPIVNVVLVC